ncbi:bifunctional hydroxymethylpyrimidine kinase/phosphomethylpyrimidine kinase [Spongiibacter taiwanensis]|uniref:bifunctional hydroxymethylpyrimidine kinase/phosphomethylpyrimidine kinase n=1 Tax=Spongiibacter taiwanensis TaxID=1748242 RepID=UPI002035950D|nr:bifunctional hydroxymethylpyrimidine kinase/phosphomethylpyrimidine kinase [Spongiibacter taiwanensis]USA42041.1 bifunctional hydroxymethylpyrimidine kinase/phosphomethylpyrimidine kinase [Spongiibacter taiwanensis]
MATHSKPIAWSIAGSDSGGGAGIQADLATFHDFGVHGCTVITAITAQNSFTVGHVAVTPRRALAAQINALDSDLQADAIKLGMLADTDVVQMVAKYLEDYQGFVVCDPVMVSTSGGKLMGSGTAELVIEKLLPRADLLTPNLDEAEVLLNRKIDGLDEVERAAADIVALGARSVLITGGHLSARNNQRHDYWTDGLEGFWLSGPNIDTLNTHGTGCTLSSAIAALMARGFELFDALVIAKAYISQGLRMSVQLGGGPGPVAHTGWPQQLADFPSVRRHLPQKGEALFFPDCDGELGLYPVVDSAAWVERLLKCSVQTVQLRVKDKEGEALTAEIAAAVALGRHYRARVFINDYWREAIAAGAYGVHLGQEDLDRADLAGISRAGLRLGVSTHSYFEVARAHGIRPSYIAIGPIFPTTSKQMPFAPQGVAQLQRWVNILSPHYTLTAIGGIDLRRTPSVLATGVGSAAMISAITQADDPEAAVAELMALHESPLV